MKTQCEATTSSSTYSGAHRCLKKRSGARKKGERGLCAHHRSMAGRKRP